MESQLSFALAPGAAVDPITLAGVETTIADSMYPYSHTVVLYCEL